MKLRIVSIPHTGTRSLWKLLNANGLENQYESRHVMEGNVAWREYFEDPSAQVIVPLRHPTDVAISAMKRLERVEAGSYNDLERNGVQLHAERVCFFRWDCPPAEREAEAVQLSEAVGRGVTVDWSTHEGHEEDWLGLCAKRDEVERRAWRFINPPARRWLASLGYQPMRGAA